MKNKDKRYVYLLTMNFLGKDYFKVGVFTGYVNSRISKILEDINHIVPIYCVRKWELNNFVILFVRSSYPDSKLGFTSNTFVSGMIVTPSCSARYR